MTTVNWNISGASQDLPNSHALIVGTSGSGKTFLIKNVILPQLIGEDLGAVIMDFNGDFGDKEFLDSLGGKLKHIRVDIEGLGFNPFVMRSTGQPQRLAFFIAAFAELLAKVFHLGEQQRANVVKAMKAQYHKLNFPEIIDDAFIAQQKKWPNFRTLVLNLEDGSDKTAANRIRDMADLGIFSENNVSFSDLLMQPCVIGINELPGEYSKGAVVELILNGLYNRLLAKGAKKENELRTDFFVIVDEAHKLAKLPCITTLMREARKFGVGVILSSQRANDFNDTIIANASTRFIFLQELKDDAVFAADKVLRNKEMSPTIQRLQRGQCIFSNVTVSNARVQVKA
jgi:DNA phosphorothioation-dependent restriction protein DptH